MKIQNTFLALGALLVASAPAFAARMEIRDLSARDKFNRAIVAIYQPQIDNVITSGSLAVGGVSLQGEAKNEGELLDAAEAYFKANMKSSGREEDRNLSGVRSRSGRINKQAVEAIARFWNKVNDAPSTDTEGLAAFTRVVWASITKLLAKGEESTKNLTLVTTTANLYDKINERTDQVMQVLVLDRKNGRGVALFMIEGHI